MRGPYIVVCRGHSGGRLVAEVLVRNGINLGVLFPQTNDTRFFAPGKNRFLQEVILNAFSWSHLNPEQKNHFKALLQRTFDEYLEKYIPEPDKPFGWKFGESVFALPAILETWPEAKIIHVIRDGRDVMLSRLDARFGERFLEPFNKVLVFGDAHAEQFLGKALDQELVSQYRNELEMQHWVTAVEYGLLGRAYPGRYLEIQYEAFCQKPLEVFSGVFDFLGISMQEEVRQWLPGAVQTSRIGKWQLLPKAELKKPLEIGTPLLRELGYL